MQLIYASLFRYTQSNHSASDSEWCGCICHVGARTHCLSMVCPPSCVGCYFAAGQHGSVQGAAIPLCCVSNMSNKVPALCLMYLAASQYGSGSKSCSLALLRPKGYACFGCGMPNVGVAAGQHGSLQGPAVSLCCCMVCLPRVRRYPLFGCRVSYVPFCMPVSSCCRPTCQHSGCCSASDADIILCTVCPMLK
jgi:hypothetical protein